ncbi:MAG TPA: efflux RND transporter permease subunit, partial [Gemmatimonadaceae bacterium]|nr:efflux RND transporter permease subunit [Gemmatimonadaceae bacterium]
PETMAATVAEPLEKAFSAIAGIDNITSTSSLGQTSITIQFGLDRNIDAAAQDVSAAMSAAQTTLPTNLIPPSYRKQNPAAAPILFYALTSHDLPLSTLDEYGETTIAQRLSMVNGVAQVAVYGSQKYAIRIQVNPAALASRGIGVDQVSNAVNTQNVSIPTGTIYGPHQTLTVQATGQLPNATAFKSLVVGYRNGAPIHLGELGNVLDDVQNNKAASWFWQRGHGYDRSIVLAVTRQPNTNTVEVASAVRDQMAEIEKELPQTVTVNTLYDRTVSINGAVRDVKFSLVLALGLVVLVIFLFLRNVVATIIPSLTLPMAVAGTFAVMYVLNFSLDNLSLMALTLAVGFVVDDAIVMLENIVRHIEMGEPPMQAAFTGAGEVGFTILSMTLSLAAVFIPIMFMGGIVGKLFNEFAITITAAILVSGVVSLTLTPMLCSRFLKPSHEETHGRLFKMSERVFEVSLHAYEQSLAWVMRHRPLTLLFSVAILVLTGVLFKYGVTINLFPPDDSGLLNATTEAAQGTSFDQMFRLQDRAAKLAQQDSCVLKFMSALGGGGTAGATNQGQLFITLKPLGQRPSADVCLASITRRMNAIPGLAVYIQNPPSIRIGGRNSKALYQYTMQSSDITQLYASTGKLVNALQKVSSITDVTSDLLNTNPQVSIVIDRDRAGSLGITPLQIEKSLADAYNEQQVSTIYTTSNEYWVVMEVLPNMQRNISDLASLYVKTSAGNSVPLSTFAHFERTVGPVTVNHSGQVPSVTISFNTPPGGSLATATADINRVAAQVLPGSIVGQFTGNAAALQSSVAGMGVLLLVTVFVIYIVLGILYESFIHPITILTGLPFAAFGALLALSITRVELDMYGFVGIIMLIGIVKKNAIMMIDFAIERERSEHIPPEKAIIEAASVRFRPIMMTTVAAIVGSLPIAIGVGATAASRRPLGVAVVGGLAFSQIVTLYVTPVFYTYLDELQDWLGRVFNRASAPAPIPAPAGGDD